MSLMLLCVLALFSLVHKGNEGTVGILFFRQKTTKDYMQKVNTNSENKEKCWCNIFFRQTKQKPDHEDWAARHVSVFSYVFSFCLGGLVCHAIAIHEASVVTPVACNNLWNCLEGNPNRRLICDGFRYGFHLGVTSGPDVKGKPACVSHHH